MKNKTARLISCSLLAALSLSMLPAQADEATPQSDEALYVMMDAYGVPSDTSVVKSYSLNGATTVTDHGNYDDIINMTDHTKPTVTGDAVTFTFEEGKAPDRFYFEGKTEAPPVTLPWSINVSYKLNGASVTAEDLAGASGLVEINVHVTPNVGASTYFKNNMMLEMMSLFDTSDITSVEAPGAQVQSLGSKKAVIFMAMPGEEQSYVLRIGSDNFSFPGLIFLMEPLTASQGDQISDLRDTKETVEDAASATNDSLNVILNTLNGLQSGLATTQQGLDQLNEARASISASQPAVESSGDTALADLSKLTDSTKKIPTSLDNAKSALSDTHASLGNIVESSGTLKTELAETRATIAALKIDLSAAQTMVNNFDQYGDQRKDIMDTLTANISSLQTHMDTLSTDLSDLKSTINNIPTLNGLSEISLGGYTQSQMETAYAQLSNMTTVQITAAVSAGILDATVAQLYLSGQMAQIITVMKSINGAIKEVNTMLDTVQQYLKDLSKPLGTVTGDASDVTDLLGTGEDSIGDTLNNAVDLMNSYMDLLESNNETFEDTISNMDSIGTTVSSATTKLDTLLDESTALYNTLDTYQPKFQEALTDTKTVVTSTTTSLTSAKNYLNSLNTLLKQNRPAVDTGAKNTLTGASDAITQTNEGLSQTGTLKTSKDTIKDTIDDEWDKYTGEDSNLLNVDTEAPITSLTSSENGAPQSIQIILRTAEISVPDENSPETTDADWQADGNVFTRIGNIFVKLFHAVVSVFSSEEA